MALSEKKLMEKFSGAGMASEIFVEETDRIWLPCKSPVINHVMTGGIPYGRIVEFFGEESSGKSLLAMDFVRSAQKLGGIGIWVDAEFAFDRKWGEENGLDMDKLVIYPEVTVERISDFMKESLLTYRAELLENEPIVLVIDSLAALDTEEALATNQMDSKAEMGTRAKAIYRMIRTRNPIISKTGAIVICINQLRDKVGVNAMFGGGDTECLHHSTLIPLVEGGYKTIKEIVDNKLPVKVWSMDGQGNIVPSTVSNWVIKPLDGKWLSIVTNGPGSKGGRFGVTCTPKHLFKTDSGDGWSYAKDLTIEDKLLSKYESRIGSNSLLEQFMWGMVLGDSSLRLRAENTAAITLRDSVNPEYSNWKCSKLNTVWDFYTTKGKSYYANGKELSYKKHKSEYTVELGIWAKKYQGRNIDQFTTEMVNPLTLAIWYMDDGSFSGGRFRLGISDSRGDLLRLAHIFCTKGFYCSPHRDGLKFTTKGSKALSMYIREFVPEPMQYKLYESDKGYFKEFILEPSLTVKPIWVDIISISEAGDRNYRGAKGKLAYDLTIEPHHNFLAGSVSGGVIVHNTTPGGRAMKFFASQRVGLYNKKQVTVGSSANKTRIGQEISFRMKKNKVGPPRAPYSTEVVFDPDYGDLGFSKYKGLLDILMDLETVTKSGNSIAFDGEIIARGKDHFDEVISEDKELRADLLKAAKINTLGTTKELLESITENRYAVKE